MYDSEFYPTPPDVIRRMLEPYTTKEHDYQSLANLTILEPSAGKGDILDYIKENYFKFNNNDFKPYAIELNPDLRFILQEKRYNVIAENFLTYTGDYYFDLILMNPPFSNGDEHLLKAWEILEEGQICCLLNAETINNQCTERRKLLSKIIKDNGTLEYLGNCFKSAEHPTPVTAVMVRLKKKAATSKLNFEFESVSSESHPDINEDTLKNPIATRDIIGNMILQYGQLKEFFVKHMSINEGLRFYSQGILGEYQSIDKIVEQSENAGNHKQQYNKFCDMMKLEIWTLIIHKIKMDKYMTNNVQKKFFEFMNAQGCMDFTKENVENLLKMLFLNRENILENAITDVFDLFTKYHKENRCYIEGWKTNDKWKVNRKVILPRWVIYGDYTSADSLKRYGDRMKTNYSYHSEYADIDKVMCYITGTRYESCYTLHQSIDYNLKRIGNIKTGDKFDNTGESEFFNYRFWRKGTLHIEFKDPELWKEFNMRACAGKQWLPEYERRAWEQQPKKYKTIQVLEIAQYSCAG